MMFHRYGDRLLVIASNMGSPTHPDWYQKLVAKPQVTVEAGEESYDAVATPVVGKERDRLWLWLWAMLKDAYPFLVDHQANTDRTIPVVAHTRF